VLPDFNEKLKLLNGLRYPWDYLRIPFALAKRIRTATMKSVLLLPEYHKTGAIVLAIDEIGKRLMKKGLAWLDMSLTADDNPQTPFVARKFGAKVYKRYQIYQKGVQS
jgi:hypothetical protein